MMSIAELLEAARTIRPLLLTLRDLDAETAQQVDQQLAELLNQSAVSDKVTAQQIRTLLQAHASTQKWLADFSNAVSEQKSSSLPGDPTLQSAIKYVCPVGNDYTIYQEANEDIPLCPTHLVPLVSVQSKISP
jgi:hypothetical protein